MTVRHPLQDIKSFAQLIKYLRDELDWDIDSEDFDDLTFDFEPEELGLKDEIAAKLGDSKVKQLRPLTANQPWGIFFIDFKPKRLPVVALRKILSSLVLKKRQSANKAERASWNLHDLLFISSFGEADQRQLALAHFSEGGADQIPTLKVLGWDEFDTQLKLQQVEGDLHEKLRWPNNPNDVETWRERWSAAFTLRHREVITTAQQLAEKLAELARSIRQRVSLVLEVETERGPLRKLLSAFREALIHDLEDDDFADMYAQTITYGLFSAAVSRTTPDAGTTLQATNLIDMVPITNPFLRELLERFLTISGRRTNLNFDELGVHEVVELLNSPKTKLGAILNDFGNRDQREDPVIHFYEDFLKQYDKKRKVERGVFYTPQPVVSYIVRSVHELLQTEFGLEDGLASTITWGEMRELNHELQLPRLNDTANDERTISPDEPFVQILDPATGTATFLVEVIEVIHQHLMAKWQAARMTKEQQRAAWNEYVPRHLLPRLYGYELMMAPYAIAHMKVPLKLKETGFTAWHQLSDQDRVRIYLTNALEPWVKQLPLIGFDALAHEAAAVNEVKRHKRFTVIVGNPPYAGHSANRSKDNAGNLTFIGTLIEDYKSGCPELFKPAQAKWLHDDYVKFLRFSQWLATRAGTGVLGIITNHGYIDNPTFRGMRRDLKLAFQQIRVLDLHGSSKKKERSLDGDPEENVFDIQQGVAILLATTVTPDPERRGVYHSDLWGTRSSKYNRLSSAPSPAILWSSAHSRQPQYVFKPQNEAVKEEFERGWRLPSIFGLNGDPAPGIVTTHDEFAIAFTREELIEHVDTLLATANETQAREHFRLCTQDQWNYAIAKRELKKEQWHRQITRILYRPFDVRWTVYSRYVAVHRRERVMKHMLTGRNLGLVTARANRSPDMDHFFCSRLPTETKCGESTIQSYLLPLFLIPDGSDKGRLSFPSSGILPNLDHRWLDCLHGVTCESAAPLPDECFHYIYSLLYSPNYRARYKEFLKTEFARIPFPGCKELFKVLAEKGGELVSLHLLESPALGKHSVDFIGGKNTEVEKLSWSKNTVWIDKAQTIGFQGVPENVWNFQVGGYQVCEKWLKDRKGRTLSKDDIAHYNRIVVALSETIRLMGEIDSVIDKHGGWPGAFATTTGPANQPAPESPAGDGDGDFRLPGQQDLFDKEDRPLFQKAEERFVAPPLVTNTADESGEPDAEGAEDNASPIPIDQTDRNEILGYVRELFHRSGPRSREQAIHDLAENLGYRRVGPKIRDYLGADLQTAVRRGILQNERGEYSLLCRTIEDYTLDHLVDMLIAAMGAAWQTRDDAITTAARHLGYRRTGPRIVDAFKSAINAAIRRGLIERNGPDEIRKAR